MILRLPGRNEGEREDVKERGWVIQEVLLSIPVLSSVFILIWRWELLDYSK